MSRINSRITYSFIIPHKNSPDLLRRLINSIPEREDIQIIVVDDNSDKEKKPSLPKRNGLQVIYLNSKQSKGAGRARNVALGKAKGKWLLFADADDYYCKGFLDLLDTYRESMCDVIYFNFEYKDGKTEEKLPQLQLQSNIINYDESKLATNRIKFCNKVPWSKMVSHDYIIKNHITFEEVPNGNDILFSICVGLHTNNISVDKRPLYVYLKNENSIQNSKPTIKGALCEIEHSIKLNNLYEYMGYPQWKGPCIKMIISYLLTLGGPFLFSVLRRLKKWYSLRNEWVDLFVNSVTQKG